MNKYLILFGAVLAVMVMVTGAEEGGFLDNLCEKCEYCKTDPSCDGCAKCNDCTDRKVILWYIIIEHFNKISRLDADFARKMKMKAVARGDVTRDAEFVQERMERVLKAARRKASMSKLSPIFFIIHWLIMFTIKL